jgi:hypothetical protein
MQLQEVNEVGIVIQIRLFEKIVNCVRLLDRSLLLTVSVS